MDGGFVSTPEVEEVGNDVVKGSAKGCVFHHAFHAVDVLPALFSPALLPVVCGPPPQR